MIVYASASWVYVIHAYLNSSLPSPCSKINVQD